MANDLALFGDKTLPVPKHIADEFNETNIVPRETQPSLTFAGKVWAITSPEGEKTKLMKLDSDGEESPRASLQVVILDYAKARGRSYFEGVYDPDNTAAPKCFSLDSVTPEDTSEDVQSPKCATCPMAVKGSKMGQGGKPVTACTQHRILAVVPVNRLDLQPLRIKLAITSDYDGQSKDLQAQGRFAFSNYLDFIHARQVPHTASMVTKLAFDPGVDYPKILFSPVRWLTDQELAGVRELRKGDGVGAILGDTALAPAARKALTKPLDGGDYGAAARAEAEKAEKDRVAAAEKAAAEKAAADLKAKQEAEAKAAAKAEKERKAAEKKKADEAKAAAAQQTNGTKPATQAAATSTDFGDDDDDSGAAVVTKSTTQAATTQAAPKTVTEAVAGEVPDEVGDVLNSWGSDD